MRLVTKERFGAERTVGGSQRWRCLVGTAAMLLLALGSVRLGAQAKAQTVTEAVGETQAEKQTKQLPTESDSLESSHLDAEGRKYQLVEIAKGREGIDYLRLDGNRIQVRNGVQLEVEREDDAVFFVRQYASRPRAVPVRPATLREATPSAAPAWAPSEFASSDRLVFERFDQGLPKSGQWRNGFALADIDSDGDTDIVFGAARKSRAEPNLFLSNGRGDWQRWAGGYPQLPYDYGDAAAADFNRDGHVDLALANHLTGLVVLISNGRGGYATWSEGLDLIAPSGGRAPDTFSSRAIEVADWNADGWPDIVALGEGPKGAAQRSTDGKGLLDSPGLKVFLNAGDGSWTRLSGISDVFGDSLAIADITGDGRLDAVTAARNQGGPGLLHVQDQAGGFGAQSLGVDQDGLSARRDGAFVFSVAVADLDRDGFQDVLLGYLQVRGEVSLTGLDALYGTSDGAARDATQERAAFGRTWHRVSLHMERSRSGIYSISVADVDGDDTLDVAYGTGDGRIGMLLGTDSGRAFTDEVSPEIQQSAPGCVVYGLSFGNLDGELGHELVAALAGEPTGLGGERGAAGCAGEGSLRAWRARTKSSG